MEDGTEDDDQNKCTCPHCGKVLGSPNTCNRHSKDCARKKGISLETKEEKARRTCPKCDLVFSRISYCKKHIAAKKCTSSHEKETAQKTARTCPHCGKVFESPTNCNRHSKVCARKKGISLETKEEKARRTCPHCDLVFSRIDSCEKHIADKICTSSNEERLNEESANKTSRTCLHCGKVLGSTKACNRHSKDCARKKGISHETAEEKASRTCPHCKKSFSRKDSCNKHILSCKLKEEEKHDGSGDKSERDTVNTEDIKRDGHGYKNERVCPLCNRLFPNRTYCKVHTHLQKCTTKISVEDLLKDIPRQTSIPTLILNNQSKCKDCGKVFADVPLLKSHRINGKCQVHECNRCKKTFDTRHDVIAHMRSNCGRFQCPLCGGIFDNNKQLETHAITHLDEDNITCGICLQPFEDKSMLNAHKASVHTTNETKDAEPFSCLICKKKLFKKNEFVQHLVQCHISLIKAEDQIARNNVFTCPLCCKIDKMSNYAAHIHFHLIQESRYYNAVKCNDCGKKMPADIFKKHAIVHQQDAAFLKNQTKSDRENECIICKMTFSSYKKLRRHVHGHTLEKPYICTVCDKEFLTRRTFKRHYTIKHDATWKGQHSQTGILRREQVIERLKRFRSNKYIPAKILKSMDKLFLYVCPICSRHDGCITKDPIEAFDHVAECVYKNVIINHGLPSVDKLRIFGNALDVQMDLFKNDVDQANTKFKCKTCDIKTSCIKSLNNHKKLHTKMQEYEDNKEPTFSCTLCDFQNPSAFETNLHYQDIHEIITFTFNRFAQAHDNGKQHVASHGCFVCGKFFCSRYLANYHITSCIDDHKIDTLASRSNKRKVNIPNPYVKLKRIRI